MGHGATCPSPSTGVVVVGGLAGGNESCAVPPPPPVLPVTTGAWTPTDPGTPVPSAWARQGDVGRPAALGMGAPGGAAASMDRVIPRLLRRPAPGTLFWGRSGMKDPAGPG